MPLFRLLTILPLLFLSNHLFAQDFVWAERAGSGQNDYFSDMARCPNGDIAMVGVYGFGGLQLDTLSLPGNTTNNSFVGRINEFGEAVWAARIGTGINTITKGIAVDPNSGAIYAAGTYYGNFTIGGTTLDTLGPFGNGFLLKYSANGVFQWAKSFRGAAAVFGNDLAIDGNGNALFAGTFEDDLVVDQDTSYALSGNNSISHFVVKLDSSGTVIWKEFVHSNGGIQLANNGERTAGIGLLNNGDVVLAGTYSDSLIADTVQLSAVGASHLSDIFLCRIDTGGTVQWVKNAGTFGTDYVKDLAVDHNDNIFFIGTTDGGAVFDTISLGGSIFTTFFLAKYSASGAAVEVQKAGIVGTAAGSIGAAVDLDAQGNAYITGRYAGSISIGGFSLSSSSGGSGISLKMFVAKYDPLNQVFDWVRTSDNTGTGLNEAGTALAVRDVDDLIVSGKFDLTLTLGGTLLLPYGNTDVYYARLSDCNNLTAPLQIIGNTVLCQSQLVQMTTTQDSLYTYQWLGNGVVLPGQTSSTYSANSPGNYAVIIDSSSCRDTSAVFTVITATGAIVNFTSLPTVCEYDAPFALTGGTPTGGSYSGSGVTNGMFDPSIAGGGNHTLTYTYADSSGCSNSATQSITVTATPLILMVPQSAVCTGDAPFALTSGTPAGGMYSGNGVNNGFFDPSIAGPGTHTVYYTRTTSGCSATDSISIIVNQPPNPVFNLSTTIVCEIDSPIVLSGATPSGGVFSGPGVSGNLFVPQIAQPGSHIITYTLVQNGCSGSDSDTVLVDSLPVAILSSLPALCESEPSINLSAFANTTVGYFIGPGVSGNNFDPSTAGFGSHQIQFITTNSCGNDTSSQIIVVHPNPTVSLAAVAAVCVNAVPAALTGGSPSGGSYSGTGVTGGIFDPAAAGIGTHSITYSYTNSNGCTAEDTASIQVNALPLVSLNPIGGICVNRIPFPLAGGSPTGGVYSGTGVVSGNFSATTAGVGTHPISYSYTDANGCLNTSQITVAVKAAFRDTSQFVGCDSVTTDLGNTYYTSGTYLDSLLSVGNCDSILVREVTIFSSFLDSVSASACYQYTSPTNLTYTTSGIYFDTLSSAQGCDSIVRTDLTINDTTLGMISPIVCDTYTSPNNSVYTVSGTYQNVLTNANGCDSVLTIQLTVNYTALDTLAVQACDQYLSPGGQTYTSSGVYFDTLSTSQSCDSIVRIVLSIHNSTRDTVYVTSCDSFTSGGGIVYSSSGSYLETYQNVFGCDSAVVNNVTINSSSPISSIAPVACDSYVSPSGNTYTASVNFQDTLVNLSGCDSIIQVNLTILPSYTDTFYQPACDSFFLSGFNQWVFASGTYDSTFTSAGGCDSAVAVVVTLHPSSQNALAVVACDSFTSALGVTYFASTSFTETLSSAYGCDSVQTVTLTINSSFQDTLSVTACDSFISPSNTSYLNSGFYVENFTRSNGCDSTVTYDVTLNLSTAQTVVVFACDTFTSPSGTIHTAPGLFTETLTSAFGCDSIVTYDVTINNSTVQTLTVSACDSFISPSGATYSSTGQFSETLLSSQGCDSTVIYDVLILPVLFNSVTANVCGAFTSPLGTTYLLSGTYSDTTTSVNGCDSILTYIVNIDQPDSTLLTVTSCAAYTSPWGTSYTQSGNYIDSSLTSGGCDSITYLDLTIVTVDTSITQNGSTLTANADSNLAAFQWIDCSNNSQPIAGATNASFVASTSGLYAVVVTINGCSDTSNCFFAMAVGVDDPILRYELSVYPNPSRGNFILDFNQMVNQATVEVRNTMGQIIYSSTAVNTSSSQIQLNAASGVYFLRVSINGEVTEKRIILSE